MADGTMADGAMADGASSAGSRERVSPWALLLLVLVVAVGFLCLRHADPHGSRLEAFFHSIGLLSHDSEWAFAAATATKSETYRALTVIGPIVTAGALAYILTDWLHPAFIRLGAFLGIVVFGRQCVALVGLDENSLALARALRTKAGEGGGRIVPIIFAEDIGGAWAARCRRHNITTYARQAGGLWAFYNRIRAGDFFAPRRRLSRVMDSAQDVISFLPSAAAQVDFVGELEQWRPRKGAEGSRAWVLLDDHGLSRRLEDHFSRLPKAAVKPRLITQHVLAARHLMLSQQLDVLADAFGQEQIHLAIYGFGPAGRAVAREAAQLYVTRTALRNIKLRITAFDAHGIAARDALLAEYPGLANVIALDVQTLCIPPAGLPEAQLGHLPEAVTAHVITSDDVQHGFSLAVSLRRWLLEPPASQQSGHRLPCHAAPIFVRVANKRGLGRLFSGADAPEAAPDGIVAFGAVEDLFGTQDRKSRGHMTVLDPQGERGARAVHRYYLRTRERHDVADQPQEARAAEIQWHKLSPQLRESNFRAYDHVAVKARAAGCRLVDAAAAEPPETRGLFEHAAALGELEHLRYRAERTANGWRLADRRLDAVGVHPDLIDWDDLVIQERSLDDAQVSALPEIARDAGQYLADVLMIGVSGHCPARFGSPADAQAVRLALHLELRTLRDHNRGMAPMLLTALAPGTDSWAAEQAGLLGIPYIAVLPLPYELLREDFAGEELAQFERLAQDAALRVELPLRFGRASELTRNHQRADSGDRSPDTGNLERRAKQYRLANAYIVERAHALIAVSDGGAGAIQAPCGICAQPGGTGMMLAWWTGAVPAEYQTPANFFPRPRRDRAPIIIDPGAAAARHDGGCSRS